jgi:hypothetical protein
MQRQAPFEYVENATTHKLLCQAEINGTFYGKYLMRIDHLLEDPPKPRTFTRDRSGRYTQTDPELAGMLRKLKQIQPAAKAPQVFTTSGGEKKEVPQPTAARDVPQSEMFDKKKLITTLATKGASIKEISKATGMKEPELVSFLKQMSQEKKAQDAKQQAAQEPQASEPQATPAPTQQQAPPAQQQQPPQAPAPQAQPQPQQPQPQAQPAPSQPPLQPPQAQYPDHQAVPSSAHNTARKWWNLPGKVADKHKANTQSYDQKIRTDYIAQNLVKMYTQDKATAEQAGHPVNIYVWVEKKLPILKRDKEWLQQQPPPKNAAEEERFLAVALRHALQATDYWKKKASQKKPSKKF